MTLRGRLIALFPCFILALFFTGFGLGLAFRCVWCFFGGVLAVYLLPPICHRLHNLLCPLREGMIKLDEPKYCAWWGSLQMQNLFNAVPALEALLRIIPGAYSVWLRLWGSRIGRGVVWTPRVEISDRSLLEIGDGVVIGHRVAFYGHIVDRKDDRYVLYLRRIRVGDDAFLGAGSRFGPGARIPPAARLPILTDVGVNSSFED